MASNNSEEAAWAAQELQQILVELINLNKKGDAYVQEGRDRGYKFTESVMQQTIDGVSSRILEGVRDAGKVARNLIAYSEYLNEYSNEYSDM